MKKYFMLSMVFAVFCTAFTSCSKSDPYDPSRDKEEEDARVVYDRNFRAYVGGTINSEQDWGFGASTRAKTRAAEARVLLDESGQGYPTVFDYNYFDTVMEYFPEGAKCKETKWYNYEFLQHGEVASVRIIYANTTANDEIGLYYYDPATESYEDHVKVPLYTDIQSDNGNLGNYIQFNRYEVGGTWFNYRTSRGYSIWTGDEESRAKRIQTKDYTIYMDTSYHFGFYVTNKDTGKTYYTNQFLNEDETAYSGAAIGDEKDGVGNIKQSYVFGLTDNDEPGCNILFAIIKSGLQGNYPLLIKPEKKVEPEPEPEPEPELQWYRIIAEDLNAHDTDADGQIDDTDFDFNDIVLDVALTETGAKCILQAAGATLKIRINSNSTLEVHKLFGVDQDVMVNTHAEKKGLKHADKDPVEFELTGRFSSIADIKIEVDRRSNDKWTELTAPVGGAASKIAVGTDFVWPDERESLKQKHPNFPRYVKENDITKWWNDQPY